MRTIAICVFASLVSCGPKHASYIDGASLGRVVVYRNGVAYYERHARVEDGRLRIRVPRDRVDDFLKSLTVVDRLSGKPLPVSFARHQEDDGPYLVMSLDTPGRVAADVILTYVTESPAWKPSYRIAVGDNGKVMLESWAVVDNTSGEDWKNVMVGVGASSALSFRYDLWSVRTVDRETLADRERFAVAPPTGLSPYGQRVEAGPGEEVVELGDHEIRRAQGDSLGVAFQGSTSMQNSYYVDGKATKNVLGSIAGAVKDAKSGEPLIGTTVVVTGPTINGSQTAITDDSGRYRVTNLPPGEYTVNFYYAELQINRPGVAVAKGKPTTVNQRVDTSTVRGETIEVGGTAAITDPSSTSVGVSIQGHQNVPRVFENAPGVAADGYAPAGPPPTTIGDKKVKDVVAKLANRDADLLIRAYANSSIGDAERRARARANTIRNQLIDEGVAPAKIQIETALEPGAAETAKLVLVAPRAPRETDDGKARVAADTDQTPVGESHFTAEKPMTVGAGTSAMVSMLRRETTGGVVYLYDPVSERGNLKWAFRAVRLDNPTGDTLEPGPVTVYGDGRFIGEGLTEPVPPGAPSIVPFALDRQVVVERRADEEDRMSKLITLQRGILTAEVQHRKLTHLTFISRLHAPTRVYLRHKVDAGWILADAPPSESKSGESHLFSIDLPAGARREVTIVEATPMERTLELASPTALDLLRVWIESPDPSPELRARLKELLASQTAIADQIQKIETLRDQLVEYRQRGDELHAQLLTLKAVRTGGDLMKVLRQKMAETSNRIQHGTIALVDAQEALLIERTRFATQLSELRLNDALAKK